MVIWRRRRRKLPGPGIPATFRERPDGRGIRLQRMRRSRLSARQHPEWRPPCNRGKRRERNRCWWTACSWRCAWSCERPPWGTAGGFPARLHQAGARVLLGMMGCISGGLPLAGSRKSRSPHPEGGEAAGGARSRWPRANGPGSRSRNLSAEGEWPGCVRPRCGGFAGWASVPAPGLPMNRRQHGDCKPRFDFAKDLFGNDLPRVLHWLQAWFNELHGHHAVPRS